MVVDVGPRELLQQRVQRVLHLPKLNERNIITYIDLYICAANVHSRSICKVTYSCNKYRGEKQQKYLPRVRCTCTSRFCTNVHTHERAYLVLTPGALVPGACTGFAPSSTVRARARVRARACAHACAYVCVCVCAPPCL